MADHLVDVVNENDEVVGQEMKSKKSELGFISRVAAVFVMDSMGKIIVCKRSLEKKHSPGKYDLSACGNVDVGETYEEAAIRELKEETGLAGLPLKFLDKFYEEVEEEGKKLKFFVGIFLVESDEEPKLNEELSFSRKMSVSEIEKEMAENPDSFCQGFRNDFNQVKNKLI